MSLDLNKLANKLNEALSNETSETLTKFLNNKRMTNNKQHTAVQDWKLTYMESIAEELRLNGVENVVVNGGTINILSLGVSMRYDYAHRPNIMADVYRCLSHLGSRIHNEHLANKLQSIKTYKAVEQ
jgi:hypothetical protein